jgi:hypothetical protein
VVPSTVTLLMPGSPSNQACSGPMCMPPDRRNVLFESTASRPLIMNARAYESENVELCTRAPELSVDSKTPMAHQACTAAGSGSRSRSCTCPACDLDSAPKRIN